MSHAASTELNPEVVRIPDGDVLRTISKPAAGLGAILLLAAMLGAFMGGEELRKQVFHSYLVAFTFFLSIALGAMIFVILQHAARAGWSVTVRRIAENMMGTVWLFAILFVPLLFGLHDLYHHWSHGPHGDPILEVKAPYLNLPFFIVRSASYFLVWILLARYFRGRSVAQDETGDHSHTHGMQLWAGPAIPAFGFTATFAAFDWLMSMQPHWYSTIFGVYFFAGCFVACMAFMALVCIFLQGKGLLGNSVNEEHYHDIGKLLFAFTVFWAYIALSQFLLIWYANIPEETMFFRQRFEGSWLTVSRVFILVGHFIIPFFFLMPRTIKRIKATLALGALYMLFIHYVDLYWLVMPLLHESGVHVHVADFVCLAGVGLLFLAVFARLMASARIVPVKDPRLQESLAFENV